MARIAGINIPPHKHAEIGLTAIYGIGRRDGADAGRINHGAFEGGFSFQPGKRKEFSVFSDEGFRGFSKRG